MSCLSRRPAVGLRRVPRGVRRAGAAALAGFTATVLLSSCASYPSADYARAACEDLSELLGLASPAHADVERLVADAAAAAQRAAVTDARFKGLHSRLREVRDAVVADAPLDPSAERRVDAALDEVTGTCADLGAPIDARHSRDRDLSWRSLHGS